MERRIGFLDRLEEDLQAAAARERLAAWAAERRDASPVPGSGGSGGAGIARTRGRRGRGRPRRWVAASAAALSLLVVAGSVGFLATGGLPLRQAALSDERPVSGEPQGVAGGGGADGAASQDRDLVARLDAPAQQFGVQYDAFEKQPGLIEATSGTPADDGSPNVAASPRQQRDLSKIVRTGRVGIVVDNGRFEPTADRIRAIAEANEGFVQESSTRTRIGNFVVRVPSRRFDATITALGELGTVEFQSQRSADVTAEFVDNKARLEILLERREVLRGFLREATTTAETLRFFSAVQEVQLDIERLQGQLAFLNDQVAISTIDVRLRERDAKAPSNEQVDNPSLGHAFDRAIAGFLAVIGAVVIGLGYLVPLMVLGVIALGIWWLIRRRRAATRS